MKKLCLTAGILAVSAAWSAGLPRDRFTIGTYCLNGVSQTEEHIRDLRDCGIDFVIGVSGTKAETRELMKKYGVLEIVGGYIPHPPGTPTAGTFEKTAPLAKFDEGGRRFLADLKAGKYPTFAELSLGDEPNAKDFPHLGKTIARTREATGEVPLYLNLFPNYASSTLNNTNPKYPQSQLGAATYEEYIEQYCKYIPLDHICWDHYVYSYTRETGIARFYDNFRIVADACRRTGRRLRFVPQVNSQKREMWLSANMLRFQGFVTMAFGGESIAWACWTKGWWHNLVLTTDGVKTQQYEKLKKVNAELKTVGADYMRFRNVATHFVGYAPGDSDLKGLPVVPLKELDTGFAKGLAAADGRQLLVGEMEPRTGGTDAKAYLIVAADDPFDADPSVRTVRFRLAEGLDAKVVGGNGAVALSTDAKGRLCFPLASSSGALLVVTRRPGAKPGRCTSYPQDQLDSSMSLLRCLEKVEKAVICREGDGSADRIAILRVLGALDMHVIGQPEDFPASAAEWKKYGAFNDLVWGLPGWMTDGLLGDGRERFSLSANAAVARLYALAGVLYDIPAYREKGLRNAAWLRTKNGGEDIVFRDPAKVPEKVRAYDSLMRACRDDLRQAIRPGGEEGRPFWNGHAMVFAYPPSFDFPEVEGATTYRFRVVDDAQRAHTFDAASPKAALAPVWETVQAGVTTVECRGLAADGRELGLSGRRKFWRQATFDPVDYRPAKRSYAEAVDRTLGYLYDWPDVAYLVAHGEPEVALGNNFVSYPSKMLSAVIRVMVRIAAQEPQRREQALKTARIAADYLLATAEREGTPLAGFTQTYCGKGQLSGTYSGQHMLVYPATAGSAFLGLYGATKDGKYLEAAVRIGRRYLALQGEDGTWYLKMQAKDGSPVAANRLQPTSVLPFLDELHAETKDAAYRCAADRAFASIDKGPLVHWDWSGQFEDIAPSKERYQNQTKHMACETAMYMLQRFPGDARRIAQARDILRFAEDQFVFWKRPCRADGTGFWMPIYPFFAWRCPAVVEQYSCYSPIDSSAAKLIRTYVALYKAEGNPLDLAKAKALGDAMVNEQDDNGRIRTYWIPEPGDDDPLGGAVRLPRGGDWYNCMTADMEALAQLAELDGAVR